METTYSMIGGDGAQYGPVTLEQLKSWIAEGRITAETKILRSDSGSWLPASQFPELGVAPAAPVVVATPAPMAAGATGVGRNPLLVHRVKLGANWFYWVAALSLVNAIIILSKGGIQFAVGLAVTQLVGAVAGQFDSGAAVGLVLNIIVAGIFAVFGLFSHKGHSWAFIVGMILYALDALLCLLFQTWLGLAFHAYVLYRLFLGLQANIQLARESK